MSGVLVLSVLLAVLAGASCYLAGRLYQGFSCFFPGLRFWQFLLPVCALTGILVLGFARGMMPLSKNGKHVLGLLGGYGMGVCLYLLLFAVAADLMIMLFSLMKLHVIAHPLFRGFVTVGVLLLTAVTCIGGFANGRRIDHVSYEIKLQDRQDISDLNVVLISDLHLGAIGSERRLQKIVDEINALQPDLVCIAGDFFDTDFASIQDPDAAVETLQTLRTTYGVYACLGNHDGGQTLGQMKDFLNRANIRLLDDAYTLIDNRLVLVGRLDSHAIGGYGTQSRKELSGFFTREDFSLPVIVLDHNPANIGEYTTEADLILCGHTHRGQVFPGSLLTNRIFTVDYGYYRKDPQHPHVIVTSGVGSWGMPMRVGTNCEIVTIRFRADD
jgi:predicted MPP superfamily phosphohydrolase